MSEHNQLNVGDVDNTGADVDVRDLLHLFDVHKDRASAIESLKRLYDVDGDGVELNPDMDDVTRLYDILRGDASLERLTGLEFRWKEVGSLGDSILQVRNILQPTDPGFASITTEFCTLYFYHGNEDYGSFGLDHSQRPAAATEEDYPFTRELTFSGGVEIAISQYNTEPYYRIYVNGKPTFLRAGDIVQNGENTYSEEDPEWPLIKLNDLRTFISTWKTETAGETITLPLHLQGEYSFEVDWGDSQISNITTFNNSATTHTYAAAGEHEIKITGKLRGWSFSKAGDRMKILNISSWGCLDFRVSDVAMQFYGCENLTISAVDSPLMDSSTSLQNCFRECSRIEGGVSGWDISEVSLFSYMFAATPKFNGDISEWDTTSAVQMNYMFLGCTLFNQDISTKTIVSDDGSYVAWDVSNVQTMDRIFAGATSFDQNLGSWDVSNCVNFGLMLQSVPLSTCNYTFLLRGWAELDLNTISDPGKVFSAATCSYTSEAARARDYVESRLGCTDSGENAGSCIPADRFVTILCPDLDKKSPFQRTTDPHNVDILDSRYWKTQTVDSGEYYDACILPLSSLYEADVLLKLRDIELNPANRISKFLVMDVMGVGGGYNYGHGWKVVSGSVRILNDTDAELNSEGTIHISGHSLITRLDTPTIYVPADLDRYTTIAIAMDSTGTSTDLLHSGLVVGGIFDSEPTKLPKSGDHLHVMEIAESLNKKQSIRIQNAEYDYAYIQTRYLGDVGAGDEETSLSDGGSMVFRNNDSCKFNVCRVAFSNSSDLSSDVVYKFMVVKKDSNDNWDLPITLESEIGETLDIDTSLMVGMYYNNTTNKLLIINSDGEVVVLSYDINNTKFSLLAEFQFTNLGQYSNYDSVNLSASFIDDANNVVVLTHVPGEVYLFKYNQDAQQYTTIPEDTTSPIYTTSDKHTADEGGRSPGTIHWVSPTDSKLYDVGFKLLGDANAGYLNGFDGMQFAITERDYSPTAEASWSGHPSRLGGAVDVYSHELPFLDESGNTKHKIQSPSVSAVECDTFILLYTFEFYSYMPSPGFQTMEDDFTNKTIPLILWNKETKKFSVRELQSSYLYCAEAMGDYVLSVELIETNITAPHTPQQFVDQLKVRITKGVTVESGETSLEAVDLMEFDAIGYQYSNQLTDRMISNDFEMAPVTLNYQDWSSFAFDRLSSPPSFVVT